MEIKCRRNNSSSSDKFSFPPVIIQESEQLEFEFGSVTSPNSPADQLFSNGKLMPHAFLVHTPSSLISYSRSGSRTSSKESYSWMSSRSNSTNSRSSTSTCTSARTSTNDAPERRLERKDRALRPALNCHYYHSYGPSRRWQLIAAVPVLNHQGSRSRKADSTTVLDRKGSKKESTSKSWFGRRFLKSFVSTCKECHAIKT